MRPVYPSSPSSRTALSRPILRRSDSLIGTVSMKRAPCEVLERVVGREQEAVGAELEEQADERGRVVVAARRHVEALSPG
jgi:hypothetical protein